MENEMKASCPSRDYKRDCEQLERALHEADQYATRLRLINEILIDEVIRLRDGRRFRQ